MFYLSWLFEDAITLLRSGGSVENRAIPATVALLQQDLLNHYLLCLTILRRDLPSAINANERHINELSSLLRALIKITNRLLHETGEGKSVYSVVAPQEGDNSADAATTRRQYSTGYISAMHSVAVPLIEKSSNGLIVRTFREINLTRRGGTMKLSEDLVPAEDIQILIAKMQEEAGILRLIVKSYLDLCTAFYRSDPTIARTENLPDSYLYF